METWDYVSLFLSIWVSCRNKSLLNQKNNLINSTWFEEMLSTGYIKGHSSGPHSSSHTENRLSRTSFNTAIFLIMREIAQTRPVHKKTGQVQSSCWYQSNHGRQSSDGTVVDMLSSNISSPMLNLAIGSSSRHSLGLNMDKSWIPKIRVTARHQGSVWPSHPGKNYGQRRSKRKQSSGVGASLKGRCLQLL